MLSHALIRPCVTGRTFCRPAAYWWIAVTFMPGSCGGDVRCVARVIGGLKCGLTERRSESREVSIAQPGFQAVEVCTELVLDRVGGTVQRRGCVRISGATGYQCEAEVRVGDHQLITVAVRDRKRLVEHRPGIGVGVIEV